MEQVLAINIDINNIDASFKRIADRLMNQMVLCVKDQRFRIAEIEFYVDSEKHDDKYTHGHELQKNLGLWYFHGSGLDITCGNKDMFGGILIRAMENTVSNEYVYGPLNCVRQIFIEIGSIQHQKIEFGLAPATSNELPVETVIAAPRVGLNPTKNPEMHLAYYRYLIFPKKKHADKTQIETAMKTQGFDAEEIKAIWG